MKDILDGQQQHWENTFGQNPDMFGTGHSEPAKAAAKMFKKEGKIKILELGGGQGRDTLFFAQNGFQVYTLDYSERAVSAIADKAQKLNLSHSITALQHDIRNPLPFDDE